MSKVEDYTVKASASLAAAEAATNARDRAFHQRAHSIWRKLIAGNAEREERAAMTQPKPTRAAAANAKEAEAKKPRSVPTLK